MYVEQQFDAVSWLPDFRQRSTRIDLSRGHGSFISSSDETTPIFEPMLQHLFDSVRDVRLVVLDPSQQIAAHADAPIAGTRYHIPLVTNEACWVFHDGVWAQLREGRIYQMDPTQIHGAVNWGSDRRIHLMVDR